MCGRVSGTLPEMSWIRISDGISEKIGAAGLPRQLAYVMVVVVISGTSR